MGINTRVLDRYDEAYKDLDPIIPAIEFDDPKITVYNYEPDEWWLPIRSIYVPGAVDELYEISTHGRVFSHVKSPNYPNGGIMIPSKNAKGYHQINIKSSNPEIKKICCKISRLVMLHFRFVPNCQYYEVDHIDGNKDNNHITNLEWVTPQENTHRAIINGQRAISCHCDNGMLLTDAQAHELYNDAIKQGSNYEILCNKYGVSYEYINNLVTGKIRPYIAGLYYNRFHYEE